MSTTTDVLSLFKYDPVADADSTFNITQGLNNNWDKIDTALLLAIAAAGAYNPEESYAVGDYCTYKGKLRKCSTAIPTGETWNAAHWTETTVAAELAGKADAKSPEETPLPLLSGVSPSTRHGGYKCVFRKNQFREVYITLGVEGDFTNSQQIFTLPEDCRPDGNSVLASYVGKTTDDTTFPSFIRVGSDGIGRIYTPFTDAKFTEIYAAGELDASY